MDQGGSRLAAPCGTWRRRRRRPRQDPNCVLLQRRVPTVRRLVGGPRRWQVRTGAGAVVLRDTDTRPERRRPIVRAPDPRGIGARRTPLPDCTADRLAERGAVGRAVRGTVGATTDGTADGDPETAEEHSATPTADRDAEATRRDTLAGATGFVTEEVVDVHGLLVRRAGRTILGPLDWTVRDGERWVVLGPNGSGKTTLLSAIGLELWPTAGTVDVLGGRYGRIDSREHRRRIGSAGSAIEAILRPDLTPVTIVMTARHAATEPWWHVYTEDDKARARALLGRLGLGRAAAHPYSTLSAGERRRTSIARALMPDPELLLLDEPAASLDLGARETLIADLADLAAGSRPSAIVLVSHHVEEIPPGFSHSMVLSDGTSVAAGPLGDVIRSDVLSRAFGLPIEVT